MNIVDLFKNKDGKIVIIQFPNPPIVIWLICVLLSNYITDENLSNKFSTVATGFILIWAYLEIVYGDSIFRRILGTVVTLYVLLNIFI